MIGWGCLLPSSVRRPPLARRDASAGSKNSGTAADGWRVVWTAPLQHLVFLPDTEIELTLVGGREILRTFQLKVHPGSPPELKRVDDRTFTTRWTLRDATTLEIPLISAKTGLSSRPSLLSIGLIRDREPRLALRALSAVGSWPPMAAIPLSIEATDDFGLAAPRLQFDRTTTVEEKDKDRNQGPGAAPRSPSAFLDPSRPVLDHQVRYDALLQTSAPKVGTVLRFVAEADDQCARGAQTGRSGVLALQVVSPDELFYEILIRQRAERSKFMTVLELVDKQTPVLAGNPTADDFLRAWHAISTGRVSSTRSPAESPRLCQEMKLTSDRVPKSHRLLWQDGVIDPIRGSSPAQTR